MATDTTPELVYVGDPMCSWCWGFAPELAAVVERHSLPVRVVVGGLRPGPLAQPLDRRLAGYLQHHWTRIEALTGQPFNHGLLEWRGWRYDTELPAIAVVTLRALAPELTLGFFTSLQRAFYADNVDITDPGSYPDLIAEVAVDREAFLEGLASAEMRHRAWQDFAEARRLDVTGFPSLLLDESGWFHLLAAGFRRAGQLSEALAAVGHPATPAPAPAAGVDRSGPPPAR